MTTTRTAPAPASEAQTTFIAALLEKQDVPDQLSAAIAAAGPLTKLSASIIISTLLKLPVKPRPVVAFVPVAEPVLEGLPYSKYAVPTLELSGISDQELLFVEIKEYRNRVYMRKLVGAPGRFNRLRLAPAVVAEIAAVIAKDPLHYSQLFGKHYQVCGRCAAELTDEISRAHFLGPTCRKAMGLHI